MDTKSIGDALNTNLHLIMSLPQASPVCFELDMAASV